MAQKSDFKTVETDLDELEEKIRKHRRKIAKKNNNSRGSSRGFISYSMVVDGAAHLQVI